MSESTAVQPAVKHDPHGHPFTALFGCPAFRPGQEGHYYTVQRDDPGATEFRVQMFIEHGTASIPLGADRDHAERMVQALNKAYNFGLAISRRRAKDPATEVPQVGRMGHHNRDEENMP